MASFKLNPLYFFLFFVLYGCNDDADKAIPEGPVQYKKDTASTAKEIKPLKAPIINITDTAAIKRTVLVIKDSAASSERIAIKMAAIYDSILPLYISNKKLNITGSRMAWYTTSSPPFYFEAGFPIDKKPSGKLTEKMHIKQLTADSAVVAHFFGPYALTYQAYEALSEWMKDHKKKPSGKPYEIYVGELFDKDGKPVDPYRVQTDIIFPHD